MGTEKFCGDFHQMKNENKGKKLNKRLLKLLEIGLIVLILYLVFHRHYREIYENISQTGWKGLFFIIGMSLGFLLPEVLAHYIIVKKKLPGFQFVQAVRMVSVGQFAKVATGSVGIVPLQTAYLHHQGMMSGESVGSIIFIYIMNKSALIFVTVLLMIGKGRDLFQKMPGLFIAVLLALFFSLLIIAALVLLCASKKMNLLAKKLLAKLPDTEQWKERKEKLQNNADAMYEEGQFFLKEKFTLLKDFGIQCLKTFWMCLVPYFCMRLFQIEEYGILEIAMLTGLSLFIAGICPNIGGLGPIEVMFLFLFSKYISSADAASVLVLYRFITYFLPFLVSVPIAGNIVRREQNSKSRE